MSSYTQLTYHFVWAPKHRLPVLRKQDRRKLFFKIKDIIELKKCHLYRINAENDHIHLLTDIHPSFSVAAFIGEIKRITSIWIKEQNLFPGFDYWQEGYGAFSVGFKDRDKVIEYIIDQEKHHAKGETFEEEYTRMLDQHGIDYKYEYLWV